MPYRQATLHARIALRWSIRTAAVSAPLAVALLLAWGFRWQPFDSRPTLVLMAYMLLLLVAVGSGCVAAVASIQLATAKAFSVGYAAGKMALADEVAAKGAGGSHLRLVDHHHDHGHRSNGTE